MVNLLMEDWEDTGLSLAVAGTLFTCFLCGCLKFYRFERPPEDEYVVYDPV